MGFANIVSEDNILSQMWQKVKIDDKFGDYYEKWLEDEVWTYYDWKKQGYIQSCTQKAAIWYQKHFKTLFYSLKILV